MPAFAVCSHNGLGDAADPVRAFATASVVMGRRGREFTPLHEALYRWVFEQTAAARRQAVRDADGRKLRRSA